MCRQVLELYIIYIVLLQTFSVQKLFFEIINKKYELLLVIRIMKLFDNFSNPHIVPGISARMASESSPHTPFALKPTPAPKVYFSTKAATTTTIPPALHS